MLTELSSSLHRAVVIVGIAYLVFTVAVAILICISLFFLARIGIEFLRYRGRRGIVCPETGSTVTIRIDALHAAVSSLLNDPDLKVSDCSRWPARQGCRQECLGNLATH